MAVDFYLLNTLETDLKNFNLIENISNLYASLTESINKFIYYNKSTLGLNTEMFIEIDPYGVTIISYAKIENFLTFGESLKEKVISAQFKLQFRKYNVTMDDIVSFANGLIELCKTALKEEKNIVAIGD